MNAVRRCALFAFFCLPLVQAQLPKGTWVVPLSNLGSVNYDLEAPGSAGNF